MAHRHRRSRAYRALMRRHHPDVGGADAVPAELQLIMDAFSVLRDPQRRRAYDRQAARNRRAAPEAGESRYPARQGAAAQEPRPRDEHRSREERGSGDPQVIPVRVVRRREPPLRVTPVRWERGPWI
ncbi:J domain-containing protein [Arthrobacter sp. QXT-31]|uniref:J domain-containing protein n=1 Tax=Arthrobacter sp. QXT-31 TaxID=1357915 RepID=UPI001F38F225|nr:DnaJ domain-containing protein [Arthrobacter sp. QXT-31]